MKREYYWERAETTAHKYILPGVLEALDKFKVPKDAYILDAGCGGGYISYSLWNNGYENVYGFDASSSAIELV